MTTQNDGGERQAKTVTVSLYPEQIDILDRVARESGMKNVSAAVRVMINDYARRSGMLIDAEAAQ